VGLGAESDQVKVAAGYARNYLLPKGFAIPVSGSNKRRMEALQKRRAEREAHELNTMSELARSLSKLLCVVQVKTGDDGKMFGTVTNGAIADQLKIQFDIALDKRKIHIEKPIRAIGEFEVEMRLHPQVVSTLKVRVESTTPVTEQVVAAAVETKEYREGRPDRRAQRVIRSGDRPTKPAPEKKAEE
jgi:large subunit ribosomal protein L9